MAEMDFDKVLKFEAKGDIKIENLIKVESGAVYNNIHHVEHLHTVQDPNAPAEPQQADDKHDPALLAKLLPIFKGNDAEVRCFLREAKNSAGVAITAKVTELVAAKKIVSCMAKRDLYEVLHAHGIYHYSESNWNKQVKI